MSKLFANIDTSDFSTLALTALVKGKSDIVKEDLYPYVDQFSGKGVTDLLISLSDQYSIPESKVLSDSFYKYEQETENGLPVNYKDYFVGIYKLYKEYGLDPIKIWLERCREAGLTPWVTLRMNDCHYPDDDTCFLRPDFFYEAREKGWMVGERYGYFKNCLNYYYPEVRKLWLDYIDEQLYKYDMDGVELDFQREIHCFDYVNEPDCFEVMNDFMRNVKKIIKKHEEIKGHKIKLGARISRDIEQSKVFGFDALTWDKEKLVDMLVVTPRFETSDSDMPIKEWKEKIKNAEIYAGIETLCGISVDVRAMATADIVRAYCNRYLSDGADGMYVFNHYNILRYPVTKIEDGRNVEVLSTCGSLEEIRKHPMRFVVTHQDKYPEGYKEYRPLPMAMDGTEKELKVSVGELPENKKVKLFIGLEGCTPENTEVKLAGNKLCGFMREDIKPSFDPEGCEYVAKTTATYSLKVGTVCSGEYNLSFKGEEGSLTYIEFYID